MTEGERDVGFSHTCESLNRKLSTFRDVNCAARLFLSHHITASTSLSFKLPLLFSVCPHPFKIKAVTVSTLLCPSLLLFSSLFLLLPLCLDDDDGGGGGGGRTGQHAARRRPLEHRSILVLQVSGWCNENSALPRCGHQGEGVNEQVTSCV